MNRLKKLAAALCVAPMVILALSGPSAQADDSWATGHLVGAAGKCMAVSGGGSADRTPIVLADCTGAVNQQWVVQPDGSLTALGKCLGPCRHRNREWNTDPSVYLQRNKKTAVEVGRIEAA
ncbi:ricin-type beta-trefoil lectin domain protein [Nocardia sputi]|uniref:ricin-type beta-trefoil lectin domain protein n=1 Tax=Nocardia sputi TaxID=2943705 RepID=UPI003557E0D5